MKMFGIIRVFNNNTLKKYKLLPCTGACPGGRGAQGACPPP